MFISSVRFRNPQVDLQAQDRAHRIGQKKEVQVFRFCTEVPIFFFYCAVLFLGSCSGDLIPQLFRSF